MGFVRYWPTGSGPGGVNVALSGPSPGVSLDSAEVSGVDPTLLFSSNWDTALGASQNAQLDGGLWTRTGGSREGEVVVSAGAPTANALQFEVQVGWLNETWYQMEASIASPPAIGEWITWRWYMNHVTEDSAYDSDHGIAWTGEEAFPTNGRVPWFIQDHAGQADYSTFRTGLQLRTTDPNNWTYRAGSLNKGQWYRYEASFRQIDASNFEARLTVYDMNNNVVLAPSDFAAEQEPGATGTLATNTHAGDLRDDVQTFVGFVGGYDTAATQAGVVAQWAAVACYIGTSAQPYNASRGW